MIILNGIKQLIRVNYEFVRDKFRHKRIYQNLDGRIKGLLRERKVMNGPFKGLRYTGNETVCSAIFPKLIGSYEKEIQDEILSFIQKKPPVIIDIGCAEGYYAVGLAKLLPETKVVAADSSPIARSLCLKLAEHNGCNNVSVTGTVTAETLPNYPLKDALIICDCEGFEKQLFTSRNIDHFKNTCLIIETHDLVDLSISSYLEDLFKNTHHIRTIASIDDIQKVKYYCYPQLEGLDPDERKVVLAESRPTIMEWLILTPK